MLPLRTRRRSLPPPDSGRSACRLVIVLGAALFLAASAPGCGKSKNENRIKPIIANITIDPFNGSPDPAVFLKKESATGDLVTVSVNLHTTSTVTFDAFTLEFDFDPNLVQVSDQFVVNPAPLGDCCLPNGASCSPTQPQCVVNSNANVTGQFLLGVAAVPGGQIASVSTDTTLVTLGFVAATVIEPPGTPIRLISAAGHGDCEILDNLVDLGIPCEGGNATMTAGR